LLRLMREYPHLYADSSALTTLNRHGTLPELMASGLHDRVLHGSDYPVPVVPWGPWLSGRYDLETALYLQSLPNPLERDYQSKRLMGFGPESFGTLARLLELEG
jgi:hypothetical protein